MNDIDQIYEILLRQEYQQELFGDLKKLKKSGSGYIACCPFHEDKNPSFSISGDKPVWNCFAGCGHGDWIEYIERKEGKSFREALHTLADAAHYTLQNNTELSPTPFSTIIDDIMETAYTFFSEQLHTTKKAQKARMYLEKRGYAPDKQEKMELGYYPSATEVRLFLQSRGFSDEYIDKSGLFTSGFGTTHSITIPYRDIVGRIKGFILRSIDDSVKPKYKFSTGTEKDTLFNAHKAKNAHEIIITEGFLDALHATAEGFTGIVGLGQVSITEKQAEFFKNRAHTPVILALDDDEAGKKGTISTAEHLLPYTSKIYILDSFNGYKDPDELISSAGIQAFRSLLPSALPYSVWKFRQLKQNYHEHLGTIEKDSLKESLFTHYVSVSNSLYASLIRTEILDLFQLTPEKFDAEIEHLRTIKNRQQAIQVYKKALNKSRELLEHERLEDLQEHLQNTTSEIRGKFISSVPLPYTFSSFVKDLSETLTGLQSGFKELDQYITFKPGTMSIIAGRPRHGKTTFMMNLVLQFIEKYPQKIFLFFSYEESRKDITLKILTNISEEIINVRQNVSNIENYLHGNNTSRPQINKAMEAVGNYLNSGRLQIFDSSHTADELHSIITALCKSHTSIGAVFVDYIQKVKIIGKFQSRQVELQKISEKLLECSKENNIPIILGAQLNREATSKSRPRLENLRESGDIENDANTVLAIYNESVEQQENELPLANNESPKVDLEIHILKNRNGVSNRMVKLQFNRPILKITDK